MGLWAEIQIDNGKIRYMYNEYYREIWLYNGLPTNTPFMMLLISMCCKFSFTFDQKKVWRMMVNNSTNINKTNYQLSCQTINRKTDHDI